VNRIFRVTHNANPGTELFRIQETGEVGIGTTTPAYTLDVSGTIRAKDIFGAGGQNLIIGDDSYLTDIDVGNTLGIYGKQNSDRAGIRLGSDGSYIFGDNGNIGIGTLSPIHTLHVAGDVYITGGLYDKNNLDGSNGQILKSTGNQIEWVNPSSISDGDWTVSGSNLYSAVPGNVGIGATNPTAKVHIVQTATTGVTDCFRVDDSGGDTTPFLIDQTGRVGIGDTTPDATLDVQGRLMVNQIFGITSADAEIDLAIGDSDTGFKSISDGNLAIYTDNQEKVRITYGGVGIAESSPNARLHVLNIGLGTSFRVDDFVDDDSPFIIDNDGNVGIGTTSPTAKVHINYAGYYSFRVDDQPDDTTPFVIYVNGDVGIGTANPSTKLHVDGDVAFGDGSVLDISAGGVTATHSYHAINAESGTSDLHTIFGGDVAGEILIITAASGDTITVKDETGNLQLTSHFSMDDKDTMVLMYDGSAYWLEISRSEN